MNRIVVLSPSIEGKRITYHFSVDGEWKEAFNLDEPFFIEYSCDISTVPEGIAVIPLLSNILPIAWIYDAEIIVPCVDKSFYESIPEFKNGYEVMYPMMHFGGTLLPNVIQENNAVDSGRTAAFFSGGVDAFNTLIQHIGESPTLLTIWGSDITFEDEEGWKNVENHLKKTMFQFKVDGISIKSSFRRFIHEGILHNKVYAVSGDGWWHGFQHGIGIISHAAPVAYVKGFSTIYIASSFTIKEKGKVTCASDPTIDNYVKFCNTQVVHDGYEFCRQDKVHNIVSYSRKTGIKAPLRVCWQSTGGNNCCHCEKCWRTMLALYAEKVDPREYGFHYTDEEWKAISEEIKHCSSPQFGKLRYEAIQTAMRKNCTIEEIPQELKWFYKIDINKLGGGITLQENCKSLEEQFQEGSTENDSNRIIIGHPLIKGSRIEFEYNVFGKWREAFSSTEKFFIDYQNCNLNLLPESIAMVPLLCNILPISWVYDAEIVLPSCDKAFLESIDDFKNGYMEMYPGMRFGGKIRVETIVNNTCDLGEVSKKNAAFFSGGVDAFNTLIQHIEETPVLLVIWGADVMLDDLDGWREIERHLNETEETFKVESVKIQSSFRKFLNERELTKKVEKLSGDGWWHGFQHGVGIIGHAAPVAYLYCLSKVYIASSFTVREKGKVTCASDPTIDNFVKFGSTYVVHDGYEYTRQDKVHNIVSYGRKTGIKAPLRVCWQSAGGKNCCSCEKCWRTILEIIAEGEEPKSFGFDYTVKQARSARRLYWNKKNLPEYRRDSVYKDAQDTMRNNIKLSDVPKEIRWFYKKDVKNMGKEPIYYKVFRRSKSITNGLFKKVHRRFFYAK